MKKIYTQVLASLLILVLAGTTLLQTSCNNQSPSGAMTREQMVARGKYLVAGVSCSDCHSPKIFTQAGPVDDTTKFLSGSPAGTPLPPIDTNALHPGYWVLGSPDLTAWFGPWGISYAANITPDSATGIGAWTIDQFIATMRKGKHLGMQGGRDILPPMPFYALAKLTDDDLKAIFAFLRNLPPIHNQVHAPVAPPDVMAMVKNATAKQ